MIKINDKRVVGVTKGNTSFSKIYKGTDLVFQKNGGVVPESEREIYYRTSDNQPLTFEGRYTYPDRSTIEFNEYVPELGCCVVRFDSRLISIQNLFSREETLTEVIKIPSTVMDLGNLCWGCNNLTYVNLKGLNKVRDIKDSFLSLTSLTYVDFSDLTSVTSIGNDFLTNAKIENIDLSAFTNVTSIGEDFLSGCKNLKSLDLSPLRQVTVIPSGFFFLNESCKTIDLTPLEKLKKIEPPIWNMSDTIFILGQKYVVDMSEINEYYRWEDFGFGAKFKVPSDLINEYKSKYSVIANNFIS